MYLNIINTNVPVPYMKIARVVITKQLDDIKLVVVMSDICLIEHAIPIINNLSLKGRKVGGVCNRGYLVTGVPGYVCIDGSLSFSFSFLVGLSQSSSCFAVRQLTFSRVNLLLSLLLCRVFCLCLLINVK